MSEQGDALPALHRRYDGPIKDHLREAAMRQSSLPLSPRSAASRDLDRLALAAVASLAQLRAAATNAPRLGLSGDRSVLALSRSLTWYRTMGVLLLGGR